MKDVFNLKKVTFVIDQSQKSTEHEKGLYYLRATNANSPVQIYGSPSQIGETFGQLLSNTIEAMEKNNCEVIEMELLWK